MPNGVRSLIGHRDYRIVIPARMGIIFMTPKIRNIAIIAHVDHGKTTLVDALLKQSDGFKMSSDASGDLIMDSNALERERGITIFSKNASVMYKGTKINIIDTPGHADFGGEVERIMRMVDGVLLLVDAKEGPMPQTKFVLRKAIQAGHPAIVVINKIDKAGARPAWALNATFDLFIELGATDHQLDFPVIYTIATQGKASLTPEVETMGPISTLFDMILTRIPEPQADASAPLQLLTVNISYDNYKGKVAVGRMYAGTLKKGMTVAHINRKGEIKKIQLTSVMLFDGLNRVDATEVYAGDVVALAGIPNVSIGETIADADNPVALPIIHIDEPTIKMTFGVNTSPFAGKEGTYSTSRNLKERMELAVESDVALSVKATDSTDRWAVAGRGELHLAILIENMRREGYELQVSKPQVIFKEGPSTGSGKPTRLEPIELVSIEVTQEYQGTIIEMMGRRLGQMRDMRTDKNEIHMDFAIPTRGLIGIRNEFLTKTKGTGIMNSIFLGYEEFRGELGTSTHGSLISAETGLSNTYGMLTAQGRGVLFIPPGVEVYAGQVIGQNAKDDDIMVNICKTKELTNFRTKNFGVKETLDVPHVMGLEDAIDYIGDDELVEVTPKNIRIRKMILSENERRKVKRSTE